ncbi:MAG: hypothetical protein U0325_33055 [Polyangiales bacterium]
MNPDPLVLEHIGWARHQLTARWRLGALSFHTAYWYPDTDLVALTARYGRDVMERVHLHTALFEALKLTSLRPAALDLGPYARHHTAALEALVRAVHHGVWAQWRYENDLPHEALAPFAHAPRAAAATPVARPAVAPEVLLFCGGGKDSLVAMKLLERAEIPYASLGYAASAYGPAAPQHALLDGLLDLGAPTRRHRQTVLDDATDAPVLALHGEAFGTRSVTAAETPSSIFAALPIALDRGYSHLVLGNEASANRGNLRWDRTGEEVNHQWGKSLAAERLLDAYVRAELVADLGVFSVLMPLHDVLIFELLRRDEAAVGRTHSCNVRKPWCRRCPKCAYVWLGLRAHLDPRTTDAVFGEDLLEVPENEAHFRGLCGLDAHVPFECVGRVEESRLALALCAARGLLGPRGAALAAALPPAALVPELFTAALDHAAIPAKFAAALAPLMRAAEVSARDRVEAALRGAAPA